LDELARQAIGVDRFASKGLTTLQVDPVLVDQVLQLQLQEETSEGCSLYLTFDQLSAYLVPVVVQRYIDQTEEKAATRLAITYGVLRRLGFTEDWVEQCLRAIHGVELDEALEWVCPFTSHAGSGCSCTSIAFCPLP
jgi:ATP-dependent RNA helicase DHX29